MAVKKDKSGKRWVQMETVVPGTPEQVWQAMATGSGNSSWFIATTVEERVGGKIKFDFGPGMSSTGEVTEWQPPHKFGYVERDWMPGAPAVATEITIEARKGGQCTVRMVHSLFADKDDWDDQMEGFEGGWPTPFAVLRLYLTHHAGEKGASVAIMTKVDGDEEAWKRLLNALGLAGVAVGDRVDASGPDGLSGTVADVRQDGRTRSLLVHVEAPAPGVLSVGTFKMGDAMNASLWLFFYGDDAEARAAAAKTRWQPWVEKTLVAKK